MLNNPVVLSIFSAISFAGWPIIARFSGLPGIWISIIVVGVSFAIAIGGKFFSPTTAIVDNKAILIGVIAGLLNGFGTLAFNSITSNKHWDISIYIPMTFGLMLAIASVGGIILLGENLSLQKIIGVLVIVLGIYLIR